jgi:hypothetical protein
MDETERTQLGPDSSTPVIDAGELTWSYGEDRITAMVRDPDSAYLYWEITDEGIATARERLGPAGAGGWCNLRVYDTTGRDFNGTNANDYFDIRVERDERDYFVMIRRPTSAMHVEIGIKSSEGYFQPIARSGRADFPRNFPSPNTTLEWMTVTSELPPSAAPYRSRYRGPEPTLPGHAGAGYVDVWRAAYAPSMIQETDAPTSGHRGSWSDAQPFWTTHRAAHIERWWHLDAWRSEWRGGLRFTRSVGGAPPESGTWHEGPFLGDPIDTERIVFEILSKSQFHLQAEGTDFTVYGPWRVTMRSADAEPTRRVLARWSLRWVRAMTPMIERWDYVFERRTHAGDDGANPAVGGPDGAGLFARGASEQWRLGASGRMWIGASEWWAAGASEILWIGASEYAHAGAAALLHRGASEFRGASERLGASIHAGERGGGSATIAGSTTGLGGPGEPLPETTERWAHWPEREG